MIENSAQPGGMLTHVTHWLNDYQNKGGFTREFFDGLIKDGVMEGAYYNPFLVTPRLDRMLKDAGAKTLYLCRAAAPLMEDGKLGGVIVESKQGRHAVRSKIVVDATGDGDIAALAGAGFEFGRESDGAVQPVSLTCFMRGFKRDFAVIKDEIVPALKKIKPDYEPPYDAGRIRRAVGSADGFMCGLPHVTGVNPLDAESLSGALVELRAQAYELFSLMRQTDICPELEFGPFSGLPGVRESRRIICDGKVTKKDLTEGSPRPDGLFTVSQSIDIHRCRPGEPSIIVERVKPYQFPYGAMLPRGLDNIIVAGRCAGGDHEALASYRIIADCLAMGEAAARASAIAVRDAVSPRDIDTDELVAGMRAAGY
jgi:hypothetical protein